MSVAQCSPTPTREMPIAKANSSETQTITATSGPLDRSCPTRKQTVPSRVKALPRKAKAGSLEALVEATGGTLSLVSEQDALGFFAHCGYAAPQEHSIRKPL